jgi:hypothetical protein
LRFSSADILSLFYLRFELGEASGAARDREEAHIFIASNCSFFGIISSMCGARRG